MGMIHFIFPLLAVIIYFATPKGCNKTINWILTGLFVLIWSFEEAIAQFNTPVPFLFDGLWYDISLLLIFSLSAFLFNINGGKIQVKLSIVGMFLCSFYIGLGGTGLYYDASFRSDFFYVEAMIALYIAQLFVASGGMMFAIMDKLSIGDRYEHRAVAGNSRNYTRSSHVGHGDT